MTPRLAFRELWKPRVSPPRSIGEQADRSPIRVIGHPQLAEGLVGHGGRYVAGQPVDWRMLQTRLDSKSRAGGFQLLRLR